MSTLSVDEALATVLARARVLGGEEVPLDEALGRVLAAPVLADVDFPPFDRAAMDGFAVQAADCSTAPRVLEVVGQVQAGAMPEAVLLSGTAVQIMTGAPVPRGATAVQMVEKTRSIDGGRKTEILERVEPGQHIAPRGTEMRKGTRVLEAGRIVDPRAIGVLAAVGQSRPLVGRRPVLALAATGDELVPVDTIPGGAQIRNSNTDALHAQARRAGAEVRLLGPVPDEASRLAEAATRGFAADVLVLTGGVSAGAFDLVEEVLERLGVTWLFTRVAIKPGAPVAFGAREGLLVFGLPGNPVSAQVTFELFVRPALLKMQGASALSRPTLEAELRGPVKNHSGRRAYIPALLGHEGSRLTVRPLPSAGSADLFAHAGATGLLLLEPQERTREAGDAVRVVLLDGFLEGGPS